ncbi:hypothetical protein NQ176_g7886 [Zarea fungicola]|uniref:Uncharacterized protein n=1 Tax=Zarea fungicola TaxID=93591 RepID=A0ACC1MW54_9HYPO|nr:hypothetical protein NQ176_g7886 [Lecanicillium fungicola]
MEDPAVVPDPGSAQEVSFLSPESFSTLDEYAKNPRFIELQEELRGVLFARASGDHLSHRTTPDLHVSDGDDSEPAAAQLKQGFDFSRVSIPKIQLIQYLKNWIIECAPYLDKFDHVRHFGIRVPVIAASSPALFYALLAFSARQMERKTGSEKTYDSLELYQESIWLWRRTLKAAIGAEGLELLRVKSRVIDGYLYEKAGTSIDSAVERFKTILTKTRVVKAKQSVSKLLCSGERE